MTHPILSRIPFLGRFVDERFLDHRRRSSSVAGIAAACLAVVLFEYRFWTKNVWDWSLLSVALLFVVLKMSLFTWYRRNQ